MSFAKVVLSGTLASDPEKRFTPNNLAVTSFNLSVENPAMGNRAGANEPFLVKVTCWRNLAEAVAGQIHKGDSILVEGKLILNSFQTQEGVQKKLFEVEANALDRLPGRPEAILPVAGNEGGLTGSGSGNNAASGYATPPNAYAPQPQPTSTANVGGGGHFTSEDLLTEDDIPF